MNVFQRWAKLKNYFSQGNIYMAIANFIITLATWHAAATIQMPLYLIIPIGFLIIIVVGFIDFHLVKSHEVKHSNTMNDMKEQLNRIEEKQDKTDKALQELFEEWKREK